MAKRDNAKFRVNATILFMFSRNNVNKMRITDKDAPNKALYKKDLI